MRRPATAPLALAFLVLAAPAFPAADPPAPAETAPRDLKKEPGKQVGPLTIEKTHKTLSPDKTVFAVWYIEGWDETIAVYDAATGRQKYRLVGHGNEVKEFRSTSDCKTLASRSGKDLELWEVSTGSCC